MHLGRIARISGALALAASICVGTVCAQPAVAMETTLIAQVRAERTTGDAGSVQRFVRAGVLKEGQELFYTLRIRNPSSEFARGVVVVQPIPKNTVYVPGSAAGPGALVTVSADGGRTFASEAALSVTDAAGVSRRAQPQDYTHIRWELRNPLAPGAIALARFCAIFR